MQKLKKLDLLQQHKINPSKVDGINKIDHVMNDFH